MKIFETSCEHKLKGILFIFLVACTSIASAKKKPLPPVIDRVDPPFWFTGMNNPEVELAFHGNNIAQFTDITVKGEGVRLDKITKTKNANYVFLLITIDAKAAPGKCTFHFRGGVKPKSTSFTYELKAKNTSVKRGLAEEDVIYLLFPDRFANGDTTNDNIAEMKEPRIDRNALKTRHGGDLQGVLNHLNYIQDLGCNALWINPVVENDQPYESYHGYAVTDPYKVDRRFGTNDLFVEVVNQCHQRNMKVVWDVVYNHWGNEHYMFRDLPDSNWIHWFPEFTRTNYRAEVLMDPYASEFDKKRMANAWFDKHMPDLNQQDPLLARYLIQNSIWWIEYAALDAFRIDTYAYPDQQFMRQLDEAIRKEYPDFFIFGETWVQGTPIQAWFPENALSNKPFSSAMQGVTDFQLYFAIIKGLNEPFGWEEGLRRIELTLSHDYLYKNAQHLVTHLDNHDLSRIYSVLGENLNKWKMSQAMLLTLRGIPQIYYGTEILMKNMADPDAKVREDFPGGWPGDKVSKFAAEGRSEIENEAFNFMRTLLQWRKQNAWIGKAKLTQFVPEEDTWVYFRAAAKRSLMCVYNTDQKEKSLATERFAECLRGFSSGKDVLTGKEYDLKNALPLAPGGCLILDLR